MSGKITASLLERPLGNELPALIGREALYCLKRNVLRNIWLQEPGLPIHEGEDEQTKGGCSGFTGESVTVAGQRRTLCLHTDRPPASPIMRLASGR